MLPTECVKKVLDRIDQKIRITFVSTLVIGLLAHMFMLTNKLPNYDDSLCTFELGIGSGLGRWFLDYLRGTSLRLQGNFSMPWLNGLLAIVLIAGAACVTCKTLEIRDQVNQILIGGVMVTFPAVTALFTFMFMATTSGFAIFLLACAGYITTKYRWGCIAGSVLIAFSLGIYQAYWGMVATILLLVLIIHCLDEQKHYMDIIKEAFRYLFTLIFSLVIYFIINRFLLWRWHVSLLEYQGVNQMGVIDPSKIPSNIMYAYESFFDLCRKPLWSINDDRVVRCIFIGLFMLTFLLAVVLITKRLSKKFIIVNLGLIFFLLLYPISVNLIYLMVGDPSKTYIYTIMVYPLVFSAILPIVLSDYLSVQKRKIWKSVMTWGVTLMVIGLIAAWVQVNNRTYLAMNLRQESVKTYFTTLITQIKQVDNYNPDYPVALVGRIEDPSLPSFADFGGTTIMGVANADPIEFVNNYDNSTISFLKYYCGYQFEKTDNPDELTENKEFQNMPTYPLQGSIRIIKDTVVVKFSENNNENR